MTRKYHLITFGCAMNKSDSERIARVLENLGYKKCSDLSLADLVIINACSVRQSAIDRVWGRALFLNNLKKKKKIKAILTGCVLENDRKALANYFDLIFNIIDLEKLPNLLQNLTSPSQIIPDTPLLIQSKKRKTKEQLSPEEESYLKIWPKRDKNYLALVAISNGCNKFCSFCAVPYVRGLQVDRPSEDIILECQEAIKNGAKEIVLLGQTVNSYCDRSGVNFAQLLKRVDNLEGNFWISFQSPYPTEFDDETIKTIKESKKIIRFINLPLQSGDDNVLKRMNRRYNVAQYKEIVLKIRKEIPEISLATDIIVGFCGETKEEFENTVKLIKEIKYDMAFVARYSPRPGTTAQKYFKDDVPEKEKIKREKILTQIVKKTALERNKKLVGKVFDVFVYAKKPNYFYGKNFCGKNIILRPNDNLLGQFVRVKIKKAFPFVLKGEVI